MDFTNAWETPQGCELLAALHQLEKFVNQPHEHIPPLFAVALTHYQFETIHPFSDGNGRIGRVLISRSLVKEGLLEHPVVYMSAYINQHKRMYADLLLRISQEGGQAWSDWIVFFSGRYSDASARRHLAQRSISGPSGEICMPTPGGRCPTTPLRCGRHAVRSTGFEYRRSDGTNGDDTGNGGQGHRPTGTSRDPARIHWPSKGTRLVGPRHH